MNFSDQIIYRFSKAQDTIGAKLFKTYLLVQGENSDKPFLDILNGLEKSSIVNVEKWFELREIRNEIAHDYEDNECHGKDVINLIYANNLNLFRPMSKITSSNMFPLHNIKEDIPNEEKCFIKSCDCGYF